MASHPRTVLELTDEMLVELNYEEPEAGVLLPFIHIAVWKWSPSAYRRQLALWKTLRPTLPAILFAQATVDDYKFEKYITRLGFRYLSDCPCTDGISRRLFVHYL